MTVAQAPSWAFDPAHSTDVAGWGFWLSIVGLVLTVIGFAFTIWQVHQARSSVEAAASATADTLADVRRTLSDYNATVELSRAVAAIAETQRHLKVASWDSVVASYRDARDAILKLSEMPSTIKVADRTNLTAMLVDIVTLSDRIDTATIRKTSFPDAAWALTKAKEHEQFLLRLNVTFQRELI